MTADNRAKLGRFAVASEDGTPRTLLDEMLALQDETTELGRIISTIADLLASWARLAKLGPPNGSTARPSSSSTRCATRGTRPWRRPPPTPPRATQAPAEERARRRPHLRPPDPSRAMSAGEPRGTRWPPRERRARGQASASPAAHRAAARAAGARSARVALRCLAGRDEPTRSVPSMATRASRRPRGERWMRCRCACPWTSMRPDPGGAALHPTRLARR